MSTNRFAAALSVLVASVLVVVAVTPAQQTPIKIGFTTDLTRTAAKAAKDMVNGFTMYLDEVGGQMAGRKVELIVEDTQGRPDVALTKLRKLVEHDRVHLVAGVLFGHLGYAMAPKVEEYKIPALFTVTAADDLTQRLKYRWIIRTGWASSQPSHPFGEYAAKTLGYRKVAVIAPAYPRGRWTNGAVRSLAGNVEDREKMLAALRKVEIPDAPRGPVKLDGHGNPIQNVYFRKVERNREGELQNTVIVTIPAVSQFWKYPPEEFLRQPLYSRDVPPCRSC